MKASTGKLTFSVSVRRIDLAHVGQALRGLEAAGIAELKVDIADGTFVPEFALGYDTIAAVRGVSAIPIHAHLLAERPERFLEAMRTLGCAAVTVPIEACLHAHRTLARIRDLGMAAGVSLLPGTALTRLEYVLGMVDHVVVFVRDTSGAAEAPLPGVAFERVRILRENLDYHESRAIVHAEGGIGATDAARLAAAGATRIVLDRPEVLRGDPQIGEYIAAVTRARPTA